MERAGGGAGCGQELEMNALVRRAGGLCRRQGLGPRGAEGEADQGGGSGDCRNTAPVKMLGWVTPPASPEATERSQCKCDGLLVTLLSYSPLILSCDS